MASRVLPSPSSLPVSAALAKEAGGFEVRKEATLGDVVGDHFWVGYSPTSWTGELPETVLKSRGCSTGSPLSARDRFHELRAFPVWCNGH